MAFAKRIFFFALVNIAMVVTISLVLSLFNVRPYLHAYGLDYQSLAIFCLVWGMGGAFFSLALSRVIAKWTMGVQLVDVNSPGEAGELARTVQRLAQAARLPKMPQVGIFESAQPNAFATGPTKARALVAVSSGLLRTMNSKELEGVLAHEITHVSNGDMVTMTLIQGVVNAFVMFLARIAAFAIMQAMQSRNDRDSGRGGGRWMYYLTTMAFEMIFGLVGAIIVASFSRWREFRADKGGATLAGREAMQGALRRLLSFQQRGAEEAQAETRSPAIAALMINSPRGSILNLFATHPSLEVRIERLNS
ncbi:MAG: protease HtpX [Bdellovibrionota bacterium]